MHWLQVRIEFKVLLIIFKTLNGPGPKYISDLLVYYKPNYRSLRSSDTGQLVVPRVRSRQGEMAFSHSVPPENAAFFVIVAAKNP